MIVIKKRNGKFNLKRKLAVPMPAEYLDSLAYRVVYGGNPEHKMNPGDFGLTPPSGARPGKSLCDVVHVFSRKEALCLLREGCRSGLISDRFVGYWPKNIWSVKDGVPLEAQLESPQIGSYHGYPLHGDDPFYDLILTRWRDSHGF